MKRCPCTSSRILPAALLLTMLGLSSLSCTTITRLWATPTPTFTPTPTVTPTPKPSPTPEMQLSPRERADYLVILRAVNARVRVRFSAIREFLQEQGYQVDIDEGKSDIGGVDVILYGALSCLDAIDDLTVLLQGKLEIRDLDRVRFVPADLYYNGKHVVIQIDDADRFSPE